MKALTRAEAIAYQIERRRKAAEEYAKTAYLAHFEGLTDFQIGSKLRMLGLGFDRINMMTAIRIIQERIEAQENGLVSVGKGWQ